ncbi:MAG: hypothetical protein IKV94_06105 [Clostridia bacterium]|nr:hypothetical protein [Clostridia bacterium]
MNEQVKLEENLKKNKAKFFEITMVLLLSAIILYVIVHVLMSSSKINEGKFRTIDAVLTSQAILEDTSKSTQKWSFNISQKNTLSLLLKTSTKDVVNAKIKKIFCNNPNVEISDKNQEEIVVYANSGEELVLNTVINEDNLILYEINIVNKNILKNFVIPEGVSEIIYDGTIFKLANMDDEKLAFDISFELEIQEANGKKNTMEIKLKLPQSGLVQEGSVVKKLNKTNFIFKLK